MSLFSAMVLLNGEFAVDLWDCIFAIDEIYALCVVTGLRFISLVIVWKNIRTVWLAGSPP